MNCKIQYWLIFLFLISASAQAQNDSLHKDSAYKSKCIYFYVYDVHSSSGYRNVSTNQNMGTTSSRSITFYFKVGDEGAVTRLRKNGKNLKAAIASDPEALKEFNNGYNKHLRKKRIANVLEFVSYAVAFTSVVPLLIGIDDEQPAKTVAGGVGVVAGITGIYVFKQMTDRQMDKFRDSIVKSVEVYNANLKKQIQ